MISLNATWRIVESTLVSNLSLLVQNKKSSFCNYKNIDCLCVLIIVSYKLTRLFTQVANPIRLNLRSVRICLLCLSLLINLVVCERLQTFELIALEFQIRIGYYNTLSRNKMYQGSWYQVVWKLDLENLYVLSDEE